MLFLCFTICMLNNYFVLSPSLALDIRNLEKVIGKHSKTLNPHHALVLEAKQNLAGELRSMCMSYEPQNMPRNALRRKLELCEEMLQILRVLDPGISRLTGIALYEYHAALVELSRRNHGTGEIKTPELQVKPSNDSDAA